jgi:O-acetyl-ADP-ribose deacetylase (regulator of RNase III)
MPEEMKMANDLVVHGTTLKCVKGDITREKVDAIVNAANSGLKNGGGVDGAIHRAGGPVIDRECRDIIAEIGRLEAGHAVITSGGNLPAKHVIHTVGPVWQGGAKKEPGVLASCYLECLKLATARGLHNVAFPAISTGVYGYPPEKAASVAVAAVMDFIKSSATTVKTVKFVLYDEQSLKIYQRIFEKALKV